MDQNDNTVTLDANAVASTSQSRNPSRDVNPYAELPSARNQRLRLTSSSPFIPTYVQSNLTKSSDPTGIYASRVRGAKILLENPARESKAKKEREAKNARRKEAKARKGKNVLGRRRGEEKGIWTFDKKQAKFDLFVPLHHLWLGYMSELLGLPPPPPHDAPSNPSMPNVANMHVKLVKADFHGSVVTVRQSKNPCLVGLQGIVILETENAFRIITKNNQLKLLPKQNAIFMFAVPLYFTVNSLPSFASNPEIIATASVDTSQEPKPSITVLDGPHIEFELYGNQFCFRSAERAGRKFKHKETIEL